MKLAYQLAGGVIGTFLAVAFLLLLPGDQGYWVAFLTGATFAVIGQFLGRLAAEVWT